MTLPIGTITFLLTDIEGSTRLQEQSPEAMRVALDRHDVLASGIITDHSGVLVKSRLRSQEPLPNNLPRHLTTFVGR